MQDDAKAPAGDPPVGGGDRKSGGETDRAGDQPIGGGIDAGDPPVGGGDEGDPPVGGGDVGGIKP